MSVLVNYNKCATLLHDVNDGNNGRPVWVGGGDMWKLSTLSAQFFC